MSAFLAELGKRLAERWMSLLVLPGLLYIGSLAVAATLGGLKWNSTSWVKSLLAHTGVLQAAGDPAVLAVLLVALLLASAASGLVATALGGVADRVWTGQWPEWTAPLIRWRQRRWHRAQQRVTAANPADRGERAVARNRIGLLPPRRPTWIADRLGAADHRIWQEYGIDLTFCWPRLWLVIPDTSRQAVQAARAQLGSATVLAGWAILYALLGLLWWPAVIVGVVIGLTAWWRARTTAGVLADLVEATVDVHAPNLAAALGVPLEKQRVSRLDGLQITERCRKGI